MENKKEPFKHSKRNFVEVKPTRSKVNAEFFKQITKIDKRTNQEQRDAYMLIHGL